MNKVLKFSKKLREKSPSLATINLSLAILTLSSATCLAGVVIKDLVKGEKPSLAKVLLAGGAVALGFAVGEMGRRQAKRVG